MDSIFKNAYGGVPLSRILLPRSQPPFPPHKAIKTVRITSTTGSSFTATGDGNSFRESKTYILGTDYGCESGSIVWGITIGPGGEGAGTFSTRYEIRKISDGNLVVRHRNTITRVVFANAEEFEYTFSSVDANLPAQ
jgi:hypothetical protein